MPDPTAHADDMKSPAEYVPPTVKDNDTLPPLWWLNPWNTVLGLLHKVDHLKATSRGEQASRISAEQFAAQQIENNRSLSKENAELKAVLTKALDDATELNKWNDELIRKTNAAKADRDALLLAMEREVKRIEGYPTLENSIDLVKWAVDEVIERRSDLIAANEQRAALEQTIIEALREANVCRLNGGETPAEALHRMARANSLLSEKLTAVTQKLEAERVVYCDTVQKLEKAEARIKQLTVFCEMAGAERDRLKDDLEKERIDREHGMCCDSAARYKAHKSKIEKLKADLADEKQAVRNLRKYLAKESRLLRKEQAKVNKLEEKLRKQAEARIFAKAKKAKKKSDLDEAAIRSIYGGNLPIRTKLADEKPAKKKGGAK